MGDSSSNNVVLVCVDQWRGDCLSALGHPVVRTPYLDGLARRGVLFRRAYSATPTCIPARAALHTGLSQERHGRVGYREGHSWRYPWSLAGVFSEHGYQTHAVGKMHVYPSRYRLGFQEVELHDGYLHFQRLRQEDPRCYDDYLSWLACQPGQTPGADYFDHGLNCNSVVARPWGREERLHPTSWVVSRATEFLYRRDPAAPFFLYLSFHRPHPPYDPPSWAFEQYLDAPAYEPVVGDWADWLQPWRDDGRPDALVANYDRRTLQRARAGYFGHMAHIDQQVNRLVEVLAEFGLDKNTWICFTSDHGEMLGEHHLWRKGYPYEGSSRVPLLLAGPAGTLQAGTVRDEVAELRDVMPTLLDCAGLATPPGVDGASLLGLARGESVPWRQYLHGEHVLLGQSLQWLVDGTEKYVWFSGDGHEQLFDLRIDPHECRDLSSEEPQRVEIWRQQLIEVLRNRPEGYVQNDQLVPGRPALDVLHEAESTPTG